MSSATSQYTTEFLAQPLPPLNAQAILAWLKELYVTSKWDMDRYPLLSPYVVFGFLAFYYTTIYLFAPREPSKKKVKISTFTRAIFILHNLILTAYSVISCYYVAPLVIAFYQIGFFNACPKLWEFGGGDFGWFLWCFYLSKYYEIIDTWVVMFKGKQPIFLQIYHHSGIIIGVWIQLMSRCESGLIVTPVNLFVHSIMYFYYALTLFGFKFPMKYTITILQMVQFLYGIFLGLVRVFNGCGRPEETLSFLYMLTYGIILQILFARFFYISYISKPTKKHQKIKSH